MPNNNLFSQEAIAEHVRILGSLRSPLWDWHPVTHINGPGSVTFEHVCGHQIIAQHLMALCLVALDHAHDCPNIPREAHRPTVPKVTTVKPVIVLTKKPVK